MPRLTDRFLAALSVDKDRKDRLVFDTVSPGLGVRVTAKGTRTFIVQWTDPVTKRKVREPLGIWGSLSIERAREAAKVRLGQVAKGTNPRAERLRLKAEDDRERAESALSFEALVDEWAAPPCTSSQALSRRGAARNQTYLRRSFETSGGTHRPG
jgi:hypothetical protein